MALIFRITGIAPFTKDIASEALLAAEVAESQRDGFSIDSEVLCGLGLHADGAVILANVLNEKIQQALDGEFPVCHAM